MKIKIKNPIYGVPITFLDKFCSEQFKIVGRADANIINENYLFYKICLTFFAKCIII